MNSKQIYVKPEIKRIEIDNEISVVLMSPAPTGQLPQHLGDLGGPTAPPATP